MRLVDPQPLLLTTAVRCSSEGEHREPTCCTLPPCAVKCHLAEEVVMRLERELEWGGPSMCPPKPALHLAMKRLKGICVSKGQESRRSRLQGCGRRRGRARGRSGCPAWLTSGLWSAGAFPYKPRLEEPLGGFRVGGL